eukprot:GHRR01001473.1.p1 GENE.GHRR01001473.1~~GHRR01001473.1.p1  ORF type:complete len:1758 (+),score=853.86 GHRR01001473.1:196-5469(+)
MVVVVAMNDPGRMLEQMGMPAAQQFVPAFPASAGAGARQPLPKQLTAAIKNCTSLDRLAQLYYAHQAVLNSIHVAAMITKLPKLDTSMHNQAVPPPGGMPWVLSTASAQQAQLKKLLQQLLLRLKAHGCSDYSSRGVANIVWALAKLQCGLDAELRAMLLDTFCNRLATAVPQDISNVLWGVAKLTKERTAYAANNQAPAGPNPPGLMQPVGFSSSADASLSSPSLSPASSPTVGNSGGVSMQDWQMLGLPSGPLQDPAILQAAASTPLLAQEQVRLLLQHLCQQLDSASVQTISNSLWAVVVLQQEHQWCLCNCLAEVQSLLSVFCDQPQAALPGHIQPVIRCMAQLASTCSNHAGDSWIKWQPKLLQRLLDYLVGQKAHMEMHHVSSVLRDVAQIVCLHLLLAKQNRDKRQQQGQQPQQQNAAAAGAADSSVGEACTPRTAAAITAKNAADGLTCISSSPKGSGAANTNTMSAEQEAEEVLARLAATGGPQDASSTVIALAMLRPQLEQLGLHHGVAGLCNMLPAAALPQLGSEAGQRLLADAGALTAGTGAPFAASNSRDRQGPSSGIMGLPSVPSTQPMHFPQHFAVIRTPAAAPGSIAATNSSNLMSSNSLVSKDSLVVSSGSNLLSGSSSSPVHGSNSAGRVSPQSSHPAAAAALATSSSVGQDTAAQVAPTAAIVIAGPGSHNPFSLHVVSSFGDVADSKAAATGCNNREQQQAAADIAATAIDSNTLAGDSAFGNDVGAAVRAAAGTSQLGSAAAELQQSTAEVLGIRSASGVADDLTASLDGQEEAAARQLTHNIAFADSVYLLAEIFEAHSSVMDMIHITACITRLSKVLGSAPSPAALSAANALLPLLGTKLLQVLPHANARGIANVLWGYGRLRNLVQTNLLPALLEAFRAQLSSAASRDSAVVLWSLARMAEGKSVQHLGVTHDLLQKVGHSILDQLAAAATAAGQQQQGQAGGMAATSSISSTRHSDPGSSRRGTPPGQEPGCVPSARDISNSLMALARLGFVPSARAAAAEGGPSTNAGSDSKAAGSSATAAQTIDLSGLSLQDLSSQADVATAAATGATDTPSAVVVSGPGAAVVQPHAVTAATAADVTRQEPKQEQQQQHQHAGAAAATNIAGAHQGGAQVLTLSLESIEAIVSFLLRHAATAKTFDLQEAATALKQLGLRDLHVNVTAAVAAQHSSTTGHLVAHQYSSSSSGSFDINFGHRTAGFGSELQGSLLPRARHVPRLVSDYRSPSSAAGGAMGGSTAGYRAHGGANPSHINLAGTQLAGLLQQQRRQQPMQVPGPAYGAGWLSGERSSGPAGSRASAVSAAMAAGIQGRQVSSGFGSMPSGGFRSRLPSIPPPPPVAPISSSSALGYTADMPVRLRKSSGSSSASSYSGQQQYQVSAAQPGVAQDMRRYFGTSSHSQVIQAVPATRQLLVDLPAASAAGQYVTQQYMSTPALQQQQQVLVAGAAAASTQAGGVQYMFVPQQLQQQGKSGFMLQHHQQHQGTGYELHQQGSSTLQQQQPTGLVALQMQQSQQQQQEIGQVYVLSSTTPSGLLSIHGQQHVAAQPSVSSSSGWVLSADGQLVNSSGQQLMLQQGVANTAAGTATAAAGPPGLGSGQYAAVEAGDIYQTNAGIVSSSDCMQGSSGPQGQSALASTGRQGGLLQTSAAVDMTQQQLQQLMPVLQGSQYIQQQQQQQLLQQQQMASGIYVVQQQPPVQLSQQQHTVNLQFEQQPVMMGQYVQGSADHTGGLHGNRHFY